LKNFAGLIEDDDDRKAAIEEQIKQIFPEDEEGVKLLDFEMLVEKLYKVREFLTTKDKQMEEEKKEHFEEKEDEKEAGEEESGGKVNQIE
jgi:hypothetical protein